MNVHFLRSVGGTEPQQLHGSKVGDQDLLHIRDALLARERVDVEGWLVISRVHVEGVGDGLLHLVVKEEVVGPALDSDGVTLGRGCREEDYPVLVIDYIGRSGRNRDDHPVEDHYRCVGELRDRLYGQVEDI